MAIQNSYNYAVVKMHNFDSERECCIFEDYADAVDYLQEAWQDYYNTEIAESAMDLDEEECYHEEDYAKVQWVNGDWTEFYLMEISRSYPAR